MGYNVPLHPFTKKSAKKDRKLFGTSPIFKKKSCNVHSSLIAADIVPTGCRGIWVKVGGRYPFCCHCRVALARLAAELKNYAAIHTRRQAMPPLPKTFNPKTATDNTLEPLFFPCKITIGFSAGGEKP